MTTTGAAVEVVTIGEETGAVLMGEGVNGLASNPIKEVGREVVVGDVLVCEVDVVVATGSGGEFAAAAAAAADPWSSCFSKAFCRGIISDLYREKPILKLT